MSDDDLGTPPEFSWVRVGLFDIDRRYQRGIDSLRSKAIIEKLTAQWSWVKCGCLTATPQSKTAERGAGRYWLVDGQHRLAAARRRGIATLPTLIHVEMTLEDQADVFVAANSDRVAVNAYALFHARLVAGEEEATAIAKLCADAGLSIPRNPPGNLGYKPGQTLAIGIIGKIRRDFSADVAQLTMRVVAQSFGHRPGDLRSRYFAAVVELLAKKSLKDREAWAAEAPPILRDIGSHEIEGRAALERSTTHKSLKEAMAATLDEIVREATKAKPVAKAAPVAEIKPAGTVPKIAVAQPRPAAPAPRAWTPAARMVSDDVVRFLRSQNNTVVAMGDGHYLFNGHTRAGDFVLVACNKIRRSLGQKVFAR